MRIVKTILLLLLVLRANSSFAGIFFNVGNEQTAKTKILFVGFDQNDINLKIDAAEIIEQVRKDLKTTDLFEIVKNSGTLETVDVNNNPQIQTNRVGASPIMVESIPDFSKYSKAGIGAIVVAQFNYDVNNNIEMRVRMWDVLDQRQLFGKLYTSNRQGQKKMANILADEIFKAITSEKKGHFNSQILYVSESGNVRNRTKKVVMMDFDGGNKRVLTSGNDLVLTPIFSKNSNEIFYLTYQNDKPQIFNLNITTLRGKKIGGFPGTTFAASINPKDENIILLSAIIEGNSDIYELNIASNTAARLTKSPAIDTTASYSPDTKSIVFISDRELSQQIYIMNSNGSEVRKLSSGSGAYSKPIFSPDGNMIAFTCIRGGQFYIGTMTVSGKNERLLTSGYVVEGARWSPNGRYLIYSKKVSPYGAGSIPKLYIIDITTGFEYKLPTPENEGATDPDWREVPNN